MTSFHPKSKNIKTLKCGLNFEHTFKLQEERVSQPTSKWMCFVKFHKSAINIVSSGEWPLTLCYGHVQVYVSRPCAKAKRTKTTTGKSVQSELKHFSLFHSINFTLILCRFACFGAFAMGPALYMWVRVASAMWPKTDVKSSLCKAITEQIGFDPFAISLFLYTMSIMDGKSNFEARKEVSVWFGF